MKHNSRLGLIVTALSTLAMSTCTFANEHHEASRQIASKTQCAGERINANAEYNTEEQNCLFDYWYLHGGMGYVSGDMSRTDVQSAAAQLSFDVFDIKVDDGRVGFKFNIGTSLTDHLSLELGYSNLGESSVAFSAETATPDLFFDITRSIQPLSVKGFTLSGLYQFWQHEKWYLHARLGLFAWNGDYDSLDVLQDQQLPKAPSINGTDVYFGVGANYQLDEDIQITLEWERYKIKNANSDLLIVGISYHFD